MTYHLLPELEQFCPRRGGALSKIVANLMRFDDSTVVSPHASDEPWGYTPDRIIVIPPLLSYGRLKGRRLLPPVIHRAFFRASFKPLLSRLKPGDIVWCHHQPYIAAALEKPVRRAGAKMIYAAHDGRLPRTAKRALSSFRPSAYVFDSDALRNQFTQMFPEWKNAYYLHNGADDKKFYPATDKTLEKGSPVVLYVGRIQAEKGVHVLIDAIRILEERQVTVTCKLIGSHFAGASRPTPYMQSLQARKPKGVTFLGYLTPDEVAHEFRSADVFCCPSIWFEAFGMVNVEAMACGVPVVASRVGGIPEIAAEGGVLLVQPGSAEELANALQGLLQDRELRIRTGEVGLASFRRRFCWPVIAKRYLEILESVR